MRGNEAVVELLNEVLTAELTAINQYFIDAKMCESWGYGRLAHTYREESIGEMRDAEELIDRILYLDGIPNLQRLGSVQVGEDVPEKLHLTHQLEKVAIDRLNDGVAMCTREGDNGSRQLLATILEGEEKHAAWVETQLGLLETIGVQLYLAQQVEPEEA
jgi:bacterioferritin